MALEPAHLQWSEDGSLRSGDFDDIYFQPKQGPEESYYVFLEQNHLPERFAAAPADFRVAELGFGSGLNFLLTARLWDKSGGGRLTYVSFEKHPIRRDDLRRIFSFWPELKEYTEPLLAQYPPLVAGFHHLHFLGGRIRLILLFGDVADQLPEITGGFDAWYLDGFSPAKNPGMWEEKLFPLIAARTKPGGTLASFSSAGAVRRGLQAAGFSVEKIKGFGTKRDMTSAKMPGAVDAHKSSGGKISVLGAGLAGASAAYALAQRGYDVTVYDRQAGAAGETSGNPVAILYPKLTADPSPLGSFHQHGFCYTRNLATALELPSWNPCGVTHLDMSDEDAARHRALAESGNWPQEYAALGKTIFGEGLRLPLSGYLSPPELCRRLLDHPKIKTVFSREILSLDEIEADAIIIALGYNAKNFRETSWLPLQSLRGQITHLRATPQSEKLAEVICHDGHITPAVNGIHYAGATFQKETPATPVIRDEDHQENLLRLEKHLPQLGFTSADIAGGRAGYRTTTPDRLPIVGACPDHGAFLENFSGLRVDKKAKGTGKFIERLYLTTGFGGHGLSGAPLAGEIIASLVSGAPLPIPQSLAPYLAPERFILRDLKRRRI